MPEQRGSSAGSNSMVDLLATIDSANATLDSVPLRRQLARSASCRGVEGLPKSEDFQLPKFVEVDRQRVADLVKESQGVKRGLCADPGGREFMTPQYLKPKMLNSWQLSRAIMPPRSYKQWRGPVQDGRELYRWHAQSCDIALPDPTKMGEQHIKWMVGHERQREKHLYPIYYHRQKIRQYWKTKENNAADLAEKEALAKLDGKTLTAADYSKPMGPPPDAPEIGPPAINISPPLFKYTEKVGRSLWLKYPTDLFEELRTMKTDYLDDAKAKIKRIDADKAERARRAKFAAESALTV
ncbi:unnamed protein product [Amoebophrya sp. A25]|nr:unnamed protein product [Amoebophrya sp. A25]|eukprot:GSA25T00016653001.1